MKFIVAFLQWGTGDEFAIIEVEANTSVGAVRKARKITGIATCSARVKNENGEQVDFFATSWRN